jgi:hypothetical protein
VVDVINKTARPIEADLLLSSDQHPQEAIKSDEMIDMGVRDKDVREALDLPGRQIRDIAQVKQNCAPLEQSFDIERRISGSPVNQA